MTFAEDRTKVEVGEASVRRACGVAFAALLCLAAVPHVFWALGGTRGLAAASGGALGAGGALSTALRAVTAGFALALLAAAGLALTRVGVLRDVIPVRLTIAGSWIVAVVMLLVAIGNFADGDRWGLLFRGPFSLVLFVLALIVALPGRGSARNGGSR